MKVMKPEGEEGWTSALGVVIAGPLSGQGVIRQSVDQGLLEELLLPVVHGGLCR